MSKTTIPTAGLADDAVDNTKLDLASNYAFTGTVTGAGGITMTDQWRLTSNRSGTGAITSNLERVDTAGFAVLGTGMSFSSGVFTFPSTGFYQINANFYTSTGGSADIITTTDNSTYTEACKITYEGGESYSGTFVFDVTNVSTHKLKFDVKTLASSGVLYGNTSINYTYFTFIRLGDTQNGIHRTIN